MIYIIIFVIVLLILLKSRPRPRPKPRPVARYPRPDYSDVLKQAAEKREAEWEAAQVIWNTAPYDGIRQRKLINGQWIAEREWHMHADGIPKVRFLRR